jgi:hypothetical protein
MGAFYDDSLTTDKDKIRALIPDITSPFLLQDEQIELVINTIVGTGSDMRLYVAECCEIIATQLGRYAQDKTISVSGTITVARDQAAKFFQDKAIRLRREVDTGTFFDSSHFDYTADEFGKDATEYVGGTFGNPADNKH